MKGSRPQQGPLTRDNDLSKSAESERTISVMIDGLNDLEYEGLDRLFAADFRGMGNAACSTKRGLREFPENWVWPFRTASTAKVCIDEARIVQGEWAAAFGAQHATHTGEFMDVAPKGRRVEIRYVDFLESCGRTDRRELGHGGLCAWAAATRPRFVQCSRVGALRSPVRPCRRRCRPAGDAIMREGAKWLLLLLSFLTVWGMAGAAEGDWPLSGRDAQGSYFSPLNVIDKSNVGRLGFAWQFETGSFRALEATPLVVDGVMYVSGNWGVVYALDAVTGRRIWTFEPDVDRGRARYACCDVVNRGVAVSKGRVLVAALDGVLYSLDARTGVPVWRVDTIADRRQPYTVTSAPEVAGDLVVIGNSGADIGRGGVRGYVTAYDLASGRERWRFYTVPSRSDAKDSKDQARALASWDPGVAPKGGTVWGNLSVDDTLHLIYLGTGNAAPYQRRGRNPAGGNHDDLYASSIVALDYRTGRVAWFYQTTPGDSWDQDACSPFVQTDMEFNGRRRHVLMQASKNGLFYVLDRANGELISGKPFTYVNWTSGLNAKGRPVLRADADYLHKPQLIYPSAGGAHSWMPMAFNPDTRLVYIPVLDAPMIWVDLAGQPVTYVDGSFGVGALFPDPLYRAADFERWFGRLPDYEARRASSPRTVIRSVLRAWDPVGQRTVWEQETSRDWFVYSGGTMSTAGGLVFQGRPDGEFIAYAADDGRVLARVATGIATMAAPMTYEIGGVQYVAVMQGYGGGAIMLPFTPNLAAYERVNAGRVLVMRLDGGIVPLPPKRADDADVQPPPRTGSRMAIKRGGSLYITYCSRCHVFGPGVLPDLRRLPAPLFDRFEDIVRNGLLESRGMGRFDDVLSQEDTLAIRAYLIDESWKLRPASPKR